MLAACVPTSPETPRRADFAPADIPGQLRLCNLPGGWLDPILADRRALAASGRSVRLCGTVTSAHTTFLTLPDVCAEPGTVFRFHGTSTVTGAPGPRHGAYRIANRLPAPIRGWYLDHASHVFGTRTMDRTAEDLARIGAVRLCRTGRDG